MNGTPCPQRLFIPGHDGVLNHFRKLFLKKYVEETNSTWCYFSYTFYVLLHKNAVTTANLIKNFKVLKKCRGKLKCLIFEMLLINKKGPKLNTRKRIPIARNFLRESFVFR